MFGKRFKDEVKRLLQESYDKGVTKGYELGYQMGKTEAGNRGFITGRSQVEQDVEEIIRREGF